ncbi:MAG: sodium-dependent transporter [Chlamydiia bacterium]|nr:sodium-dependent transporter [Chlamydiia bacterium]
MSQPVSSTGWKKQSGFVWSMIGSAVGFANILSFSACAYKNGGGAFLIPYVIALIILGVPLLLLEGIIGKTWGLPLVASCDKVCGKIGKTFGWLAVIACATIGSFYIVLTGYSIAYTYFAGSSSIPEDTATFFTKDFLHISPSLFEVGSFSWPVFAATLVVALFSWFILRRGIKDGVEKICSLFMPCLAVIVTIFAVAVAFLPGGLSGYYYYLTPDFSRLLDVTLWRDVFGQLLFSLSLGLGIVVGYSRHTGEKINVVSAMKWVAIGDFTVSFISGSAIFGCIAHISLLTGVPFERILSTDSSFEIGFVIFPKILQHFGSFAPIFGVIFFFSLFIAGVTGVFSIIESIAGNVEVEFSMTRKEAVSYTTAFIMASAILFCMGNGSHIIDALAPMVMGINMLIGSLALIIIFIYCCPQIAMQFRRSPLRLFVPIVLLVILAGNIIQEFNQLNAAVALRWLWFVCAFGVSILFATKIQEVCYVPVSE